MQSAMRIATAVLVAVAGTLEQIPQSPSPKNQEERQAAERLSRTERFSGTVTLKNKAGKAVPIHVSVKTWGIAGGREPIRLPEQDFLIAQLHSGRVTTVIGGKQQVRGEGEFWVVSAGTQMAVEVTGEAAVLQTMTLRKP